jgi:hypothetical protein
MSAFELQHKEMPKHVETLYPLSEAARQRRVVRFTFLTDVDAAGYAMVEHEGKQKMLHLGYSVLARKVMKWWTAGNDIKGSVCEVTWVDCRLDVWVHRPKEGIA